ncbi:MAG: flippase-like domain-containing protein, partial [Planctomycetaceae bacterium]|nr:flippase-like domain-containing protein [Planctomycetaceae bacterium]
EDLAKTGFDWRGIRWQWLGLSSVIYAAGLLPACWYWRQILRALGQEPGTMETARAYYVGHLGKYVPGKALVVIIRTALISGPRVDTTVAAVSIFIETLTMMAVGACVAAVILMFQFPDSGLVLLAIGLMLGAGLPTWPPLFRWLVAKLQVKRANQGIEDALRGVDGRLMVRGWLSLTVGWGLLGFSLWAVMESIPQVAEGPHAAFSDIALFTACVSLAMVAGFLSLLPGGVGVRELVVMTLISTHPAYGPVVAIVSAVLLRFSWLMAELVVSAILYVGVRTVSATEEPGTTGSA